MAYQLRIEELRAVLVIQAPSGPDEDPLCFAAAEALDRLQDEFGLSQQRAEELIDSGVWMPPTHRDQSDPDLVTGWNRRELRHDFDRDRLAYEPEIDRSGQFMGEDDLISDWDK